MSDDSETADGGSEPAAPGDDLAWETTDTRIDYSCPGFDIRMDDVRLPDETESDFHYVDEPAAVVVLPLTPDGDVVVIDEWRQAVGRTNRGLPAGGTEPDDDDDYAAAARRELAEETGHEAEAVEPLVTVEPANGIANSVHHYFVARGCEPSADQNLDFNESIRPTTVGYDDLERAVLAGEVRDARTVLGVLYYELAGE
ncbi:NUDIX hydrolase [Haloferax volcanii]|uniref:NUDIX family hydrolase n=3 Tax=Haloferacaceae TaxID=1644056 RepID=D4GTM4_HALVD|nr:NUDIX hydrolase [Haloferax volcanii]ADE03759.1 NUDIX family hydrolase [Haloferax volcanii DS2]MBS8119913.1 NUDIX hydrolase [Haloferax volcanii]MBS8124951.1 NUDIX hydrolase [Haloferax volcanii]MBS8128448.1 NUDIX hydrolase [Haloferax volcanii]MBS8132313.1 NUDIX hydrolase [Haloferax volcanii]